MHILSVDSYTAKGDGYECKCSVVGNPKQKVTKTVTAHLSSNYVRNCDTLSDIINTSENRTTLPAFNRNIRIPKQSNIGA